MPFIDINSVKALEVLPGCKMRTPYGENLMLSYLEMDEGAIVPMHHHPHEQGGMLLKGKLELTMGDEVRVVEAGAMFIIPRTHHIRRSPSMGRLWCWMSSALFAKIMRNCITSISRFLMRILNGARFAGDNPALP